MKPDNTPTDIRRTVPMIEHTRGGLGAMPATWSADAGYASAANRAHVKCLEADHATQFLISTLRMKHGRAVPDAPRGRIPADATDAERMARRLEPKEGRRI